MRSRGGPELAFLGSAVGMAFAVILIFGFIAWTAAPVLAKEGFGFITGSVWNYDTHQFGILVFLWGTLILTAVTMILAVPIGVMTAIYLAEWAPGPVERILRPAIELLVGIPSVVYGIFGFFVLDGFYGDTLFPFLASLLGWTPLFRIVQPDQGLSILLAATILTIMVLPTIVALSQEAIRAVPREQREASLALGATGWETIRHVVLPAALSGIVTSVVLAMMRAVGETMAVVMVIGNSPHMPTSILDTGYTMTSKILNDIGYYLGEPEPRSALFAIALVLFVIELGMVAGVRIFTDRLAKGTR